MTTATALGYDDLPALLTRLTGDEKHDSSAHLDARRRLGALRPRPPARRPLPALEGPRPDRVLRSARCQGVPAGRGARRLRQLRLDARLPPRPPARPRRRDLERLARPRPADRRRRARSRGRRTSSASSATRELDEGSQLGSGAVRGPRVGSRRSRRSSIDNASVDAPAGPAASRSDSRSRAGARGASTAATTTRSSARCRAARWPRCRRRGGAAMTDARAFLPAGHRGALARGPRRRRARRRSASPEIAAASAACFNVGIREQLMIGVAAGLALEGYRADRRTRMRRSSSSAPYEQIKLDLGHQDVGAVLVSVRRVVRRLAPRAHASGAGGRRAVAALPGWTIDVPGHVDEIERMLAARSRTTTASTSG